MTNKTYRLVLDILYNHLDVLEEEYNTKKINHKTYIVLSYKQYEEIKYVESLYI